jgi:hypothetical protein
VTSYRVPAVVGAVILSVRIVAAGQGGAASALTLPHLDKLRQIAMSADLTATPLSAINARILGLADAIEAKQLMGELPAGKFYLAFSVAPGTDDILFAQRTPEFNYVFLTDSSLVLRAAMIVDTSGARLVRNEQATGDFEKSLETWNELAAVIR